MARQGILCERHACMYLMPLGASTVMWSVLTDDAGPIHVHQALPSVVFVNLCGQVTTSEPGPEETKPARTVLIGRLDDLYSSVAPGEAPASELDFHLSAWGKPACYEIILIVCLGVGYIGEQSNGLDFDVVLHATLLCNCTIPLFIPATTTSLATAPNTPQWPLSKLATSFLTGLCLSKRPLASPRPVPST